MKSPSKYPLTLRDRVRFRFGLAWGRHIPTLADVRHHAANLALVALLVAAYGVVDLIETRAELALEISTQQAEIDALGALVADCLNGRARFLTPDRKRAVVCHPAESFPL